VKTDKSVLLDPRTGATNVVVDVLLFVTLLL